MFCKPSSSENDDLIASFLPPLSSDDFLDFDFDAKDLEITFPPNLFSPAFIPGSLPFESHDLELSDTSSISSSSNDTYSSTDNTSLEENTGEKQNTKGLKRKCDTSSTRRTKKGSREVMSNVGELVSILSVMKDHDLSICSLRKFQQKWRDVKAMTEIDQHLAKVFRHEIEDPKYLQNIGINTIWPTFNGLLRGVMTMKNNIQSQSESLPHLQSHEYIHFLNTSLLDLLALKRGSKKISSALKFFFEINRETVIIHEGKGSMSVSFVWAASTAKNFSDVSEINQAFKVKGSLLCSLVLKDTCCTDDVVPGVSTEQKYYGIESFLVSFDSCVFLKQVYDYLHK